MKLKIKVILMILGLYCLNSPLFSQNITLNIKNITVKEAVEELKEKSGYSFVFEVGDIDTRKIISISAKDEPIENVIKQIIIDQPVTYEIKGKNIILTRVHNVSSENEVSVHEVTGVITDEAGIPVIGATVQLVGGNSGTISDMDGAFRMNVPPTGKLLISYIGYTSVVVSISGQSLFNIQLKENTNDLDEIVVIGYGTQRKIDLTGSISQVSSNTITSVSITSPAEALRGRIAGMDVTSSAAPGANPDILIRGKNSITGSNAPLWVVDGIPIDDGNIDINPSDIETMDVLKDASATAIYGSRGSNGVIIVTTKRAPKGSKIRLTLDSYYGIQQVSNKIKMMNGSQFAEYKREAYRARYGELPEDFDSFIFDDVELNSLETGTSTDWIGLLLDNTGWVTNHNFGIGANTDITTTSASFGYYKEQSIFDKVNYERFSLKLNSTINISNKLTFNASALVSHGINNKLPEYVRHYTDISPLGTPYDEDGQLKVFPHPNEGQLTNPLTELQNNELETRNIRLLGNINLKYQFNKALSYQVIFGPDMRFNRDGKFVGSDTRERSGGSPLAEYDNSSQISYTFDQIVNFKKTFNKIHALEVTGVYDYQKYRREKIELVGSDMDYDGKWYNLGAAATVNNKETKLSEWELLSYMGRVNYSLMNRYLFTLTGRYDGSSRLSSNNRWAFFPSMAFAWRISEEFFAESPIVENIKLRLSWGQTGNSGVSPYETLGRLGKTLYDWDNSPAYGFVPTTIPNKDLKWERTEEFNIGMDWSLLNNRISGTIDLYDRKTKDLILKRNIPITSGYSSITQNVGSVKNKGIELTLSGVPIQTKDWRVSVDLNFSKNVNKIIDLYGDKQDDIGNKWFIGEPIDVSYVYDYIGVWQLDEEEAALNVGAKPGDPKYATTSEDGIVTTNDRIIISNLPKWIGGMNLNVEYKEFDFSAFLYTRQGVKRYSEVHGSLQELSGRYNSGLMDYWTPENPTNSNPRPNIDEYTNLSNSTYLIKDMSFVRLANITLGYSFNKSLLSKIGLEKLRIYGSVKNPLTWTKYDGWDPENGTRRDSHPPLRTFTFGVNVAF